MVLKSKYIGLNMGMCKECGEVFRTAEMKDGYCQECLPREKEEVENIIIENEEEIEDEYEETTYRKVMNYVWGFIIIGFVIVSLVNYILPKFSDSAAEYQAEKIYNEDQRLEKEAEKMYNESQAWEKEYEKILGNECEKRRNEVPETLSLEEYTMKLDEIEKECEIKFNKAILKGEL